MLIHMFLRGKTEKPVVEFGDHTLSFKANDNGDVVCDVPDEIASELLANCACGMREYTKGAKAETKVTSGGSGTGSDPTAFVITPSDGDPIDLGKMDDLQVRAFAEAQGLAKPHHTKTGDKLRQAVIDALKAL